AKHVFAGGLNNNVSLTSQANFLTIEDIHASGDAGVVMKSGVLYEYTPSGSAPATIAGQTVSLSSPYNIGTPLHPFHPNAVSGLTVAATAASPSSAGIFVVNTSSSPLSSVGASTRDGSVTIQQTINTTTTTTILS